MDQPAIHLDVILARIGLGSQSGNGLPVDRHVPIKNELLGFAARGVGFVVSMFQTGTLNTYAFILTVGVLIILGVSIF